MSIIKLESGERAHLTRYATVVCEHGSWLDRLLMLRFVPASLRAKFNGQPTGT